MFFWKTYGIKQVLGIVAIYFICCSNIFHPAFNGTITFYGEDDFPFNSGKKIASWSDCNTIGSGQLVYTATLSIELIPRQRLSLQLNINLDGSAIKVYTNLKYEQAL